jgi:hypothetical protein
VDFILGCQLDSGEIPWFEGGYTDPWDHTESAMGLAIGGELEAARRAYRWLAKMLAKMQLPDGSWWASYRGEEADNPRRRESNFVAYVATGVWHFYRLSGDREFLREMWPVVDRAIGFVLSLQTEHGEIHWAVNASGEPKQDALVTGCSSIFKSLECAHNISVSWHESDWVSPCDTSPTASTAPGRARRATPWTGFTRCWPGYCPRLRPRPAWHRAGTSSSSGASVAAACRTSPG